MILSHILSYGDINSINCSGMVYLSDWKFVHMDLAIRDCFHTIYQDLKVIQGVVCHMNGKHSHIHNPFVIYWVLCTNKRSH